MRCCETQKSHVFAHHIQWTYTSLRVEFDVCERKKQASVQNGSLSIGCGGGTHLARMMKKSIVHQKWFDGIRYVHSTFFDTFTDSFGSTLCFAFAFGLADRVYMCSQSPHCRTNGKLVGMLINFPANPRWQNPPSLRIARDCAVNAIATKNHSHNFGKRCYGLTFSIRTKCCFGQCSTASLPTTLLLLLLLLLELLLSQVSSEIGFSASCV